MHKNAERCYICTHILCCLSLGAVRYTHVIGVWNEIEIGMVWRMGGCGGGGGAETFLH